MFCPGTTAHKEIAESMLEAHRLSLAWACSLREK